MSHRLRLLVSVCCALLAGGGVSCRGLRPLVKAKPAGQLHLAGPAAGTVEDARTDGPFQVVRRTTDPRAIRRAETAQTLFIAPVTLQWLKETGRTMRRLEEEQFGRRRPVREVADELHAAFTGVFNAPKPDRPRPRYRVVARPDREALVLELAITELTATSPTGNVLKTAAGMVVGPVSMVASPWVKGTLAVEGRLTDPVTGRVVYAFADRESNPMTIFSVRNFHPTAFAKVIARQWAEQFEEATRGTGAVPKDAPFFRLNPF